MHALVLALVAGASMLVSDVLYTIMVIAEANGRGWLAGAMDCIGWYVGIATTTISVTTLAGNSLLQKGLVLLFVGAANLLGTKLGQVIGSRITGQDRHTTGTLAGRVSKLEAAIASHVSAGPNPSVPISASVDVRSMPGGEDGARDRR